MDRTKTRVVKIGDRVIGGGNPILIQSMTNTKTEDVAATVAQIQALTSAGCDIIRCAVPNMEAASALEAIKKQITINEDNCVKGTYEGNITLADAKYICTSYSVHILVGTEDIKAGVCDFSIHRSRMRMLITGKSTDSARTFQLVSTEPEALSLIHI